MPIDTTSRLYDAMVEHWDLPQALLGGTPEMRRAGTKYLPREPKEEETVYKNRLDRSFLINGYKDTLNRVVSKPFSQAVTVEAESELDDRIDLDNIDLSGTDLTQFASEVMFNAVHFGLTHILVDYPAVSQNITLADERRLGVRPFMVEVTPDRMLGWKTELNAVGTPELTEIRFTENVTKEDPSDPYREAEVCRIRVIRRNDWELHERRDNQWMMVDSGPHSLGRVPIVTVYTNRVGTMQGHPAFEELAWVNLAHWQSYSDQRNLLRFARVGLLMAKGVNETEAKNIRIAPNFINTFESPNAEMKFVEHSGDAIKIGRDDLQDLMRAMEMMGMQPFLKRSGMTTATEKIIDDSKVTSDIQAWIKSVEAGLLSALKLMYEWLGMELPSGVKPNIFSDFSAPLDAVKDSKTIIDLFKVGLITPRTTLDELKRRGTLSENVDSETESEEARQLIEEAALRLMPDDDPSS